MEKTEFEKELESLLNKHSKENDSDTPDFILAEYMINSLKTFNQAINRREVWFNRILPVDDTIVEGEPYINPDDYFTTNKT